MAQAGLVERGRIECPLPNGKKPIRQDLEVAHAS